MRGCGVEDFSAQFAQVTLNDEAFEGWMALRRPPLGNYPLGVRGDERISWATLEGTRMSMTNGAHSMGLVGIVKGVCGGVPTGDYRARSSMPSHSGSPVVENFLRRLVEPHGRLGHRRLSAGKKVAHAAER
jgi:hypothetical protein